MYHPGYEAEWRELPPAERAEDLLPVAPDQPGVEVAPEVLLPPLLKDDLVGRGTVGVINKAETAPAAPGKRVRQLQDAVNRDAELIE